MAETKPPAVGSVGWVDLTVEDAPRRRDFYAAVVGWEATEVDMGGYSDFAMQGPAGDPAAGICHARGVNADQPPVWLVYFVVADLDAAIAACRAGGGELVAPVRNAGPAARFAILRDPEGASFAIYQSTAG